MAEKLTTNLTIVETKKDTGIIGFLRKYSGSIFYGTALLTFLGWTAMVLTRSFEDGYDETEVIVNDQEVSNE